MTTWPVRTLLNTVYAFLAEQFDAADRVSVPVFLSVGVDAKEVAAMSKRDALDSWLSQPSAETQRYEQAVAKALGA